MTVSVTCVGLAVIDLVMWIERVPSLPGKHFARRAETIGGGPAATAAVTIARLGGTARFAGRIGADERGDRILAGLTAEGVDVSGVRRVEGATSPVSSVFITPEGDRTIINHTDPNLYTVPPDAAVIQPSDAVLADARWPAGALAAMAAAQRYDIPGVLDFDRTDPAPLAEAAARATHVVAAEPALAEFVGAPDPATALRRLRERTDAWIAVTTGGGGVSWLEDGGVQTLRPPTVEVVDTLGAGDVFHGAFTLALAEGRDEPAALRFATAAAALKCTRPVGRAGIPSRPEVEALVDEVWT
jgi:sulfofructose kinase